MAHQPENFTGLTVAGQIDTLRRACEAGDWPSLKTMLAQLDDSDHLILRRLARLKDDLSSPLTREALLTGLRHAGAESAAADFNLPDTIERKIMPFRVIAEDIRSAFNVGGIFRTCETFGAAGITLTGYTAGPDHPNVRKTAKGCADLVPWEKLRTSREAAEKYRAQGLRILALETARDAVSLYEADFPETSVFIIGNEKFGLDQETLGCADMILKLPTPGSKTSLNVVAALAACLSEYNRRWFKP